jgi:hypothetical protein
VGGGWSFDPADDVENNEIDVGFIHGLSTGQAVIYRNGGGASIGGLTDGQTYYTIVDPNRPQAVKLALTQAAAAAGTAVTLDPDDADGHLHELKPVGLGRTAINQESEYRNVNQSVSVTATTEMELVVMAGIFDINISEDGVTNIIKAEMDASGWRNKLKLRNNLGQLLNPLAAEGETAGLGGSVLIMPFDNTTVAVVEGDVDIITGSAGSLQVSADSEMTGIELSQSGAQGGKFVFSGSFAYINHDSLTLAQIESGAVISGGKVAVSAGDDTKHVSLAGSVISGEQIGIGASVALNEIDRRTVAVVGSLSAVAGSGGTSIDAADDILVTSTATGDMHAFSLSAAWMSKDTSGEDKPSEEKTDGPGEVTDSATTTEGATEATEGREAGSNDKGKQGKFGIGISGDVSINTINDTVQAWINDTGTFNAQQITVTADNQTDMFALAGGVLIKTDTDGSGLGIVGSYGQTKLRGSTSAIINGAVIESSTGLALYARRIGELLSITAGVNGSLGKKDIAIAGSVSNNDIINTTVVSLSYSCR